MPAVFRRIGLLTFGIVIGLVIVEGLSRLLYTGPWYERLIEEQVLKPGSAPPIALNQFGLRDREYESSKPANTARVLILGDSFTFGTGVPDNDAVFPRLLEKQLNADPAARGLSIEILNGGIAGSMTDQWVGLLRTVGASFQPDVILVVFFLRDGTRTSSIGGFFDPIRNSIVAQNQRSVLYRYLYVYRFLKDRSDRERIAREYVVAINSAYVGNTGQTEEWRNAQSNLRQIKAMGDERGARVGLVIFPVLVDLGAEYAFTQPIDAIRAFGADEQIPTLDLLPAFLGSDAADLWVSAFDQHPNARGGHKIAADAIQPFLRSLVFP
jgi:lysophospholipase L1-like esterase